MKLIYIHTLCLILLCFGSFNALAAQDCVEGTWQSPPNSLWGSTSGSFPVGAETEHFQLRWDSNISNITDQVANDALARMENILNWLVSEPVNWPMPYCNSTVKYKTQIFANEGWGLSGGGAGNDVPAMWVGAGTIRAAAQGEISGMVHEFTHSMQFNTVGLRKGKLPGWMWESHAEFMTHQYPDNGDKMGCIALGAWQPHLYYGTTRTRYCAWMFWDFAKNEMGFEAINIIWTSTSWIDDQDPLLAFRNSNNLSQIELQDMFGRYAMANVNWDYIDSQDGFDRGAVYRYVFGPNTSFSGYYKTKYLHLARMEAINVEKRRFVVSDYFAPQRYGYNHVRLVPDTGATEITVDFRGVVQESMVADADIGQLSLEPETPNSEWTNYVVPRDPASNWRWGVVAIDDQGVSRYSSLMSGTQGQLTFALNGDEQGVYLVVVATPDEHHSIFWEQKYHSIYRYPYKVQLSGAFPEGFEDGYRSNIRNEYPDGRVHPNGGGWVANGAQVAETVYIGPNAAVLGGTVLDNARIEDYAAVWSGTVSGNAIVGGLTQYDRNIDLGGNAEIKSVVADKHTFETDYAYIYGDTKLFGDLILTGLGATTVSKGVFSGVLNASSSVLTEYGADRTDYPVEVTAPVEKNWPLASSATLDSSYVSPWESLAAVNNGITPGSSADKTGGAYGNWQGASGYGQTEWVSLSWDSAETLNAVEVYWWADGGGIAPPNIAYVEYWDGINWVDLGDIGVLLDQYNRLDFEAVKTTSIRISMSSDSSTGILEIKAWGADSLPNVAPAVSLLTLATTYTVGDEITFIASAVDIDGSVESVSFYSGSTLLGTDTTQPYTFNWTDAVPGTYSITAVATDNDSAMTTSSAVSIVVEAVTENVAPTVSLITSATTYTVGDEITFIANAVDIDGSVESVSFYSGTTLLGTDTTLPYTFNWRDAAPGTYSITAVATDNDSAMTTSSAVSIVVEAVTENVAPTVSLITSATTYTVGDEITFIANAVDIDGGVESVSFYSGSTLLGTDTTLPYTFNWTDAAPGTYSITAVATDNDSAMTTSSAVSIVVEAVTENVAPTVSLITSATTYTVGDEITFIANAVDIDGSVESVSFYSGTTLLGTDTTQPYTFNWTDAAPGTYSITAVATDNDSAMTTSSEVSIVVEAAIENVAPTVSLISSATTYTVGDEITFIANAVDIDGSVESVSFYSGTTLLGTDTTQPYTFNWTDAAPGTYSITAVATDNDSAMTTSSVVNIVVEAVIGNVAPTVNLTTPDTTYRVGDTITLAADAVDPDGIVTSVSFYSSTTLLGTDTTQPFTFNWTDAAPGTYSITAVATDNDSAMTTSSVVNIVVEAVIGNVAPTVNLTTPDTTYRVGDRISLAADAADSDGIVKSVAFYSGNTLLGTDSTQPYAFIWTDTEEGTYSITAIATDNEGVSTTSPEVSIVVESVDTSDVSKSKSAGSMGLISILGLLLLGNFRAGGRTWQKA